MSSRLATQATVERDGCRRVIASVALVPGDLVVIGAGDALPADGLFVRGERVQVDESTLTGEAFPVRKEALAQFPRNDAETRVDGRHWGFAGTRLLPVFASTSSAIEFGTGRGVSIRLSSGSRTRK